MKIPRSVAVALFVALNFKTADKWTIDKLGEKLKKIEEHVDEDTKLGDAEKKNLAKVTKALAANEEIEITDDTPAPAKVAPKPAKKEEAEETEEAEAPAKTAKTTVAGGKGVEKKKAAKPPKEEKPKGPSADGVRFSKSRPYLAGIVVKKLGIESGVTQKHVDELNKAYGKPNDHQSWFVMRNAWHSVRGYMSGDVKELTGKKAAAAAPAEETETDEE